MATVKALSWCRAASRLSRLIFAALARRLYIDHCSRCISRAQAALQYLRAPCHARKSLPHTGQVASRGVDGGFLCLFVSFKSFMVSPFQCKVMPLYHAAALWSLTFLCQ